jgi:PAS domain S-box-containing protein
MNIERKQLSIYPTLFLKLKQSFTKLVPYNNHLRFWIISSYSLLIFLCVLNFSGLFLLLSKLQSALFSQETGIAVATLERTIAPLLGQLQTLTVVFGIVLITSCLACMVLFLSLLRSKVIQPLESLQLSALDAANEPSAETSGQIAEELQPFVHNYQQALDASQERYQELQDQLRHTALLTRLSIELRESFEPEVIVQQILSTIVLNLSGVTASIITIDSNSEVAYAASMRGQNLRVIPLENANKLLEEGLAGWVLRQGYHVILSDVSQDERWLQLHATGKAGSAMSLLLTQARLTLGVLTITHPEPGHFTSRDLILLEGVASQAAVVLNSAQRNIEVERRRQQALLLFAMSQSLTIARSPEELAEELLRKGQATFDACYTAIFLNNHQDLELFAGFTAKQRLFLASQEGPRPTELAHFHRAFGGIAQQAWQSHQASSGKLSAEAAGMLFALTEQQCHMPGYVALPLLHNGTCFGVFILICATNGTLMFSADMWSVLTTFTNVAASAFANAQLMQQLQERAEELEELVDKRTIQLQESRNLLRVVFDNLPDGLVLLDQNTNVLTINTTFSHSILGLSPQQIVSHHYPTVLKRLQTKQQVVLDSPSTARGSQRIRCRDSSGDERWYEVDRYPIQTGDSFQAIERWRDITRQEELHRQLLLHEQLSSMGRLALSVVHEVGNPLQSVLGCLDLCQEDTGMEATSKEYLSLAYQELDRMQHILQRLRNLYRPPQLTWSMCQLNEIVQHVQRITERQLQRYKIHVETDLDPNLPLIYAQEDALQQVFLNLILNAQEAMTKGGRLTLRSRFDSANNSCHFEIGDTGVGFDSKRLPHIFEPFQSNKTQGLGLGLYLCKQIIDRHAGQIEVTSTSGVGTTVSLWFPQTRERDEESNYPNC